MGRLPLDGRPSPAIVPAANRFVPGAAGAGLRAIAEVSGRRPKRPPIGLRRFSFACNPLKNLNRRKEKFQNISGAPGPSGDAGGRRGARAPRAPLASVSGRRPKRPPIGLRRFSFACNPLKNLNRRKEKFQNISGAPATPGDAAGRRGARAPRATLASVSGRRPKRPPIGLRRFSFTCNPLKNLNRRKEKFQNISGAPATPGDAAGRRGARAPRATLASVSGRRPKRPPIGLRRFSFACNPLKNLNRRKEKFQNISGAPATPGDAAGRRGARAPRAPLASQAKSLNSQVFEATSGLARACLNLPGLTGPGSPLERAAAGVDAAPSRAGRAGRESWFGRWQGLLRSPGGRDRWSVGQPIEGCLARDRPA